MISKIFRRARTHARTPEALYTEILRQWVHGFKVGEFPTLASDSIWIYTKARLSAYLSQDEWLVLFELATFYSALGDYVTLVYAFGNKLPRSGLVTGNGFTRPNSEFAAKYLNSGMAIPEQDWCPDPLNFDIRINGERRHYALSMLEFEKAGIDIGTGNTGDQCLDNIVHITHMLSHILEPEEIFYPNELLLGYVEKPASLPLFARLYDWCHPGIPPINKPSDSICLRNLAQALAYNQPNLYDCPRELVITAAD